jgi:lipid-A-disaccharide synthase
MEGYTVVGFVEALSRLPAHLRLLRRLRTAFRMGWYDLVILVDYPGLNLRLAAAARRAGIRVLYYIAPQLWAWRPGRARRLASVVDRLAVVLPFEPDFFASVGVKADFVGHPLADRPWPDRHTARATLGLAPAERVLAILPGSRGQEIDRLWPAFRDTGQRALAEQLCDRVVVAGTPEADYPGAEGLLVHRSHEAGTALAAADAALVKSGTSTLEAAMTGTPMVVAYRVHPLTAALARSLVTVPWISLVNLVAGREVVPELVQRACTVEALFARLRPLLDPESIEARTQRHALELVRARLSWPGAAERVAGLAGELLAA